MRYQPMTSHSTDDDKESDADRQQVSVVISNPEGMHLRATRPFVELAAKFESEISVSAGGRERDGKSLIDLMQLAAGHGTELLITAHGDDATEALEQLEALVKMGFYER